LNNPFPLLFVFWFLFIVSSFSLSVLFSGELQAAEATADTNSVSDWNAAEQFPKDTVPEL
jgi:hypothetical protein